jgi:hypothetical protein
MSKNTLKAGKVERLAFEVNAADLSAGTPQYFYAPFKGYIEGIDLVVQTAIVTGGVIKVQKASGVADGSDAIAALADVVGATITVANSAEAGFRQTADSTEGKGLGRYVEAGDLIAINVDAAFNGGGAVRGSVRIRDTIDLSKAVGY